MYPVYFCRPELLTMFRRLIPPLHPVDVLTVLFSAALALLTLLFHARIPEWEGTLATSLAIIAGLPLLAVVDRALSSGPAPRNVGARAVAFLHDWAFAPLAYVIYLQMHALVGPIRGAWLADPVLIATDRWIFGTDPSLLLERVSAPWLTELLQVAYTSFYLLMLAAGIELYVKRDRRFYLYAFSCALGFFISFVGYLCVPAVGPRFTLFDVATVERQLPGLLLTPALRSFVDGGGLVPPGLTKSAAAALAPRDVFPSGHTMMTLVAIYWAMRFRLKARWGIAVAGALLVFSTVYLRYHYAIDVLAGAFLAAVCVAISPAAYRWVVGE